MSKFYSYRPNPGDSIGNYKVENILGEGTYGIVYRCLSKRDQQVYAIKMLKFWEINHEKDRQNIEARFEGEYKCGKNTSPYLVHSIEYGADHGNPYIVMEYLDGGSLKNKEKELRDYSALNRVAVQILMGLRELHKSGVIHRDIKPDNVMFDRHGNARLGDFGIAGFLNARMTVPNFFTGKVKEIFGTYAYIAPEQLLDHQRFNSTSDRTDIFSFGIMMYELISGGHYPYGKLETDRDLADYIRNASTGRMRPIRDYRTDTPDYWKRILEMSLHHDFERRVKTVDEILNLLPGISEIKHTVRKPYDFVRDNLVLMVTQGEETGRTYPLSRLLQHPDGIITIGLLDRLTPGRNHIEIVEDSTSYVSNYHATIERNYARQTWTIKDGQFRNLDGRWMWKESTNGVYVNYEKIDKFGCIIAPGDIITLADVHLKVETEEAINEYKKNQRTTFN